MSETKIVVLGGNGFIGRHLVKKLVGDYPKLNIVVLDRFADYQIGTEHPFDDYPNVQIVPGNFLNRGELASAIKNATYVFHLISSTNPATSSADPFIDIDTNVRSSVELFELCVEQKVQKVIFLSSGGSVYGDIDSDSIAETQAPRPRSPYAIGKLTIEHYLRYFKFTHGLDYIVYRVANPYGPGQNIHGKQGVVPIFINKFLHGEPLTIFGDGSMVRDYIYIDDLVAMITYSFNKNNKYAVYNLGSGKGASVNALIDSLRRTADASLSQEHLDTPPTYVHRIVLNIDRFVNEFKITPTIGLDEGIRRTWDYVKNLK